MSDRYRVLVADDEEGLRFVLRELLKHEGCDVELAVDGAEALARARAHPYDLYVLDLKMPRVNGMDVLRAIRTLQPGALVVMMTAFGTQKLAIEALQAGAYDYFTKPFEMDELRIILRRALENQALRRKVHTLEEALQDEVAFHRLVGGSEPMRRVYELIQRAAAHDVTILIIGESGVGKELAAEAVHECTPGRKGPFVKVNCAAIPEPLLESELFGHARGAFTGAVADKPGKFEVADGGSILLDEIGEMPLALQVKLLRVLQDKRIERVGETRPRKIDVRILCSTNRDLGQMVEQGAFRKDLYFRINVLPIALPPLRQRMEDLPPLVNHIIRRANARSSKQIAGVAPEALRAMEAYPWPGNVRELENVIHRAIVLTTGEVITLDSLPPALQVFRAAPDAPAAPPAAASASPAEPIQPLAERIGRVVREEEKRLIQQALERTGGHRQETADLLGISRKSLHNKMVRYDLLKFRPAPDEAD